MIYCSDIFKDVEHSSKTLFIFIWKLIKDFNDFDDCIWNEEKSGNNLISSSQ